MNIKKIAAAMVSAAVVCSSAAALAANPLYQIDAQKSEDGLVYTGQYTVEQNWVEYDLTADVPADTRVDVTTTLECIEGRETDAGRGAYFQFKLVNDSGWYSDVSGNQAAIKKAGDTGSYTYEGLTYYEDPTFLIHTINADIGDADTPATIDIKVEMTPTAYKVTAGEGVTLNGVAADGYVTAGSTVSYTYNEKEYTSEAITAPTVIEAPTEDEAVIDAAALNDGKAYEDGSMGWTVTAGDPETTMTSAKWLITNDEGVTVQKEAAMTTFTGKAVFGLVLTSNAIGDNTISSVQFDFE